MSEYSKQLADCVDEYLASQEWRYEFDGEEGIFRFGMSLDNRMHSCRMAIKVGEDVFTSYAIAPVGADADSMLAVNSFITRANYGLKLGNFELDHRDGELRYKSSHFCGRELPSLEVVERVVDVSFQMWQTYGDGLLNVIFAGAEPAQEIARIEVNTA